MPAPNCSLCHKRKASRFCPALGQSICAVCCGTEREVTIDCPVECSYLIAAHRYEAQRQKPEPPPENSFRDVSIAPGLVHEFGQVIAALAYTILAAATADASTTDADVLAALEALAQTYRTLLSGLYYERAPAGGPPLAVYAALTKSLEDLKQGPVQAPDARNVKDSQLLQLVVFLYRLGQIETNGRRRSRKFLGFLRAQFPAAAQTQSEPSRIILP